MPRRNSLARLAALIEQLETPPARAVGIVPYVELNVTTGIFNDADRAVIGGPAKLDSWCREHVQPGGPLDFDMIVFELTRPG